MQAAVFFKIIIIIYQEYVGLSSEVVRFHSALLEAFFFLARNVFPVSYWRVS